MRLLKKVCNEAPGESEARDVQYRLWRDLSDPTYLGPRVADKIVVGLILMRWGAIS